MKIACKYNPYGISRNADTPVVGATGVFAYKGTAIVSSAMIMTDVPMYYGGIDTVNVYSKGIVARAVIDNGGLLTVSKGGIAQKSIINRYGSQVVSSGGVADGAMVFSGGELDILNGGTCLSANIVRGEINVSGTVKYTQLNGGLQTVSSGGVASSTIVNSGGTQYVSSGGTTLGVTLNSSGGLSVQSGGYAENVFLNSRSYVDTASGTIKNIHVSSGGEIGNYVENTHFDGMFVHSGGSVELHSGHVSNAEVHENALLEMYSSGSVANVFVYSGGTVHVHSGVTHENITGEEGAVIIID